MILIALLALAAWWWWQGRARPVDEVAALEPVTEQAPMSTNTDASMLAVHVIGRVRRPGIVEIPEGSRVADAIEAAGGFRDAGMRTDLNLARLVVDGEQIDVRRRSAPQGSAVGDGSATATSGPVDLNRADATALDSLPGIGPVLAARIIAWRDANGPFPNVDVLGEVSGIGPALMDRLRPLVTV